MEIFINLRMSRCLRERVSDNSSSSRSSTIAFKKKKTFSSSWERSTGDDKHEKFYSQKIVHKLKTPRNSARGLEIILFGWNKERIGGWGRDVSEEKVDIWFFYDYEIQLWELIQFMCCLLPTFGTLSLSLAHSCDCVCIHARRDVCDVCMETRESG